MKEHLVDIKTEQEILRVTDGRWLALIQMCEHSEYLCKEVTIGKIQDAIACLCDRGYLDSRSSHMRVHEYRRGVQK